MIRSIWPARLPLATATPLAAQNGREQFVQTDTALDAAHAVQQAALWRKGLNEWGQSPDRIQRLRDAADVVVYTPGSNAGLPISILKSFAAPAPSLLEDTEMLGDRISASVTSLLGLVGIDADPIQSREHILLSTILNWAWQQAKDLDLAAIIQYVQ